MQDILKKLNTLNIKIGVKGGQLDIKAPKGVMTADLIAEIKQHKDDLLVLLHTHQNEEAIQISKAEKKENYALSSAQYRLWLLHQMEGGNAAYNIPSVYKIQGPVDVEALEYSLILLIRRHEILRTNFRLTGDAELPVQFILPEDGIRFKLNYVDVSEQTDAKAIVDSIEKIEINYSFDLEHDPLIRVSLIKTGTEAFRLICVLHHIVSDGWSASIIIKDLFAIYSAQLSGNQPQLQPLPIQYKDYAEWQQSQLLDEQKGTSKTYWMTQLRDKIPILDIPGSFRRPLQKTYCGATVIKRLDAGLVEGFRALCRRNEASVFMGYLTIVNVLLFKYTRQNTILIGSPIAGRELAALQEQIGFYVNLLALKSEVADDLGFEDLLNQVKRTTLAAYQHQVYPFDQLIQDLGASGDRSRNPLFDVVLTTNEHSAIATNTIEGLYIEEVKDEGNTSKFDLEFAFNESADSCGLALTYNTDLFNYGFIDRMAAQVEALLEHVVEQPLATIKTLNYLPEAQIKQLTQDFNQTESTYPRNRTYIELFRERVSQSPDLIAIKTEGGATIRYRELDKITDNLAQYLMTQYSIGHQDTIGVKLDRSEWLVISFLAVLKAGAIYLPIDSSYPEQRIAFMEQDSACKGIIDESLIADFEQSELKEEELLNVNIACDSIAYTIYTSGSTGKPKGVLLSHSNLLNLCFWHNRYYGVSEASSGTLYAGIAFDASIWEMAPYLLAGATLHPINDPTIRLDPEALVNFLNQNQISHSYIPTTLCHEIIAQNLQLENTTVLTGGDRLQLSVRPKFKLYNNYGPTENTVVATAFNLEDWEKDALIPIGKPVDNSKIYILDDHLALVPIGVPGKLFIAGDSLAQGYLNRPELTAEKFRPHPFVPGAKIYDTGDLGKWLPDGNIAFLGRMDHQVKLRGFRIELGEIENNILSFSPQVTQAVVMLHRESDKEILVAYFTATTAQDIEAMSAHFHTHLPAYMVPSHFLAIEEMPLTQNGKVDIAQLLSIPLPEKKVADYAPPETEIEEQLAGIWQKILKTKSIGIYDNFFELGGYSLQATKMLYEINECFEIRLQLKEVFKAPNIHELAKLVDNELIFKAGTGTAPHNTSDNTKTTDVWEI